MYTVTQNTVKFSIEHHHCTLESGGGVLQKNSYGDAQSRVWNFDHLYTSKSVILWPISIPFFCKKHPIWGKLGAFLAKFFKMHPIFQIGRTGYVTITHPSIYQNLRKCTSKPLSIPVYHLSVITPPPPPPGLEYTHGSYSKWFLMMACMNIFVGHYGEIWGNISKYVNDHDVGSLFFLIFCLR